MQTQTQATPGSKQALGIGHVPSLAPVLMLLMSGVMKLVKPPAVVEGFNHLGLAEHHALPIGIRELACTVRYVILRTSGLGAILLTGYLGGRDPHSLAGRRSGFAQVLFGMAIWGGLFLRDPRLRVLIPWRRPF